MREAILYPKKSIILKEIAKEFRDVKHRYIDDYYLVFEKDIEGGSVKIVLSLITNKRGNLAVATLILQSGDQVEHYVSNYSEREDLIRDMDKVLNEYKLEVHTDQIEAQRIYLRPI